MNLCALMPARNEAWCIGYTARVAMQWADELIVAAHLCEDATIEILRGIAAEFPGRVFVVEESRSDWAEADIRQRLLTIARDHGATTVAMADADEVVAACHVPLIRDVSKKLQSGQMLRSRWACCWGSLDKYRDDDSPFGAARVPFIASVCGELRHRPSKSGSQLHARIPDGCTLVENNAIVVMHLQHVSRRRLLAKQAWYQMTEALSPNPRSTDEIVRTYRAATLEADATIKDVPPAWWRHGIDRRLIQPGALPWQERECKRLLAKFGKMRFDGLDLFGVTNGD